MASKTTPNRIATLTGGTTQGYTHDPIKDDKTGQLVAKTIFQLLDEQRRCLQTMRSFAGVMPGERRGCLKVENPFSHSSIRR